MTVDIVARYTDQGATRGLKSLEGRLDGVDRSSRITTKGVSGLSSILKGGLAVGATAAVGGIAAIGAGFVALGTKAILAGSDVEEMRGKFEVVFKNTAPQVTASINEFADAVGRNRYELQGYAANLGDTLKPLGFAEDAAADMSVEITKLAVDLASFNNMETSEAAERLTSAVIGNVENLQAFGVVANAASIEAKALEMGIWDGEGALDAYQKAQAVLQITMEGTTDAQGDAARTAGSFANRMRALKSKIAETTAEIGQKLLPVVTPLVEQLGDLAIRVAPKVIEFAEGFAAGLQDVINFVKGFFAELKKGQSVFDAAIEAFLNWTNVGENLTDDQFAFVLDLIENIEELIARVREAVQPIVEFITKWVSVKDVLIAAGAILGGVVISALISIVSAVAPVIAAAVALIAIVSILRNVWEQDIGGVRTAILQFVEDARPVFEQIVEFLQVNIPVALEFLHELWVNVIWPVLQKAVELYVGLIKVQLAVLVHFFTEILPPALEYLRELWVNVIWPAIQNAIEIIVPILVELFTQIDAWLKENIPIALETLRATWVDVIWPAIQQAVDTVVPILVTLFTTIKTWLTEDLPAAVETIRAIWVDEVWPVIQQVIEDVMTVVEPIFEEIARWLDTNIPVAIAILEHIWINVVWPAIQKAIEDVWTVVEPIWLAITEWLDTTGPVAAEAGRSAFADAWEGIKTAVTSAMDTLEPVFDAIKAFGDWLSGHVFNFSLSIPDIPDWAIPGSPLPIHTAWKNFSQYMGRASFMPKSTSRDFVGSGVPTLPGSDSITGSLFGSRSTSSGAAAARPLSSGGGRGVTIDQIIVNVKIDRASASSRAEEERLKRIAEEAAKKGVKKALAEAGRRSDIIIRSRG